MTRKLILPDSSPIDNHSAQSESEVLMASSMAAFFHDTLGKVRQSQNFEATEVSEFYVVNLLETFTDADLLFPTGDDGRRSDEALAMILHRAVFSGAHEQIAHYRRLGDLALYIAGMFAERLCHRRSVGLAYYIDMGQSAYGTLADNMRGMSAQVFRDLYRELADTFANWVEVLREVSETLGLTRPLSEMDTAEVYERWERLDGPQSKRLAGVLLGRGLMPVR